MCRSKRHLTLNDEIIIWLLNELGLPMGFIAKYVGCTRPVVYEKLAKIKQYIAIDAEWFYNKVNQCADIPTLY